MSLINGGKPFRYDQIDGLAMSPDRLRQLVRERELRRVVHGVYIDSSVLDSRDVRVKSLALVLPLHGVFCLGTASWVLEVDTFAPSERYDLVPTAMVPHHRVRVRDTRGARCIEGYLSTGDVMMIGGVPITTATRTACDILRRMRRPWALAGADALLHAGLTDRERIRDALDPLVGFPGIVQARELARLSEPAAESSGESIQRLRLIDAGFPRPRPQHVVRDSRGRELARLDNAYPAALVACEHDGAQHHTEAEDRQHDEQRRTHVSHTYGWRFVVTTRSNLFGKDDTFEREVGALLGFTPRLPRRW
ncbi:MAG: hypothetical protein M3419_12385 [Actinomycetota bacterium]|nr:hypothetical protein [Actinomycetota bacterium]